jgi:hypothetical protein
MVGSPTLGCMKTMAVSQYHKMTQGTDLLITAGCRGDAGSGRGGHRSQMDALAPPPFLPRTGTPARSNGDDLDHPGLSGREVDRAVDIDPIAPARLFDCELLLFWCPAAGRPRRMGRMHRVRERTASSSPKEFSNFS